MHPSAWEGYGICLQCGTESALLVPCRHVATICSCCQIAAAAMLLHASCMEFKEVICLLKCWWIWVNLIGFRLVYHPAHKKVATSFRILWLMLQSLVNLCKTNAFVAAFVQVGQLRQKTLIHSNFDPGAYVTFRMPELQVCIFMAFCSCRNLILSSVLTCCHPCIPNGQQV